MTKFGYDPSVHFPPSLTDDDRGSLASELLFIGHSEPTTGRMINTLQQAGLPVRVWGKGWRLAWNLRDRREIRPIPNQDYAKAIALAKVSLCFLSKLNRNECCGRTFEIPAIGGFLLAERTLEQTSYFAAEREAVFFGSEQELLRKARHFLEFDTERETIARAGHDRCLRSAYTYKDRVEVELQELLS
jgi:hypothetical protein